MKVPLYAQLYAYLLDEIKGGRLQPGDRVPTEKQLAAQFGVSAITSKKALEELVRANVLKRTRGKGSFVAATLPNLDQLDPSGKAPLPRQMDEANPPSICLILPDFTETYGLKLVYAIEARLSAQGAFLVLRRTCGEREQEQEAIRRFAQSGGAGLIVVPVHGEFYNEELLRMALERRPLVTVDRYLKGIATCAVYTDNRKAAFELTTYLLEHGHEHIAFLSPPVEGTSSIEERFEGFCAALTERALGPRAQYQLTNLVSTLPQSFHTDKIQTDEEKVRAFLAQNPQVTAFVAAEYNIALILADALASVNKHVPDDCAIVCFDSPDNPFGPPAFTHIEQDETSMGQVAVDLLMAQLRQEKVPPRTTVPFRLVEGQSTARGARAPHRIGVPVGM
ncbi:MAG TPA: GntR family transcriptional regulator [Chloroflexota bacterium]|nr:GntR family transcriptional regulator [Chloroflexota bacterium]